MKTTFTRNIKRWMYRRSYGDKSIIFKKHYHNNCSMIDVIINELFLNVLFNSKNNLAKYHPSSKISQIITVVLRTNFKALMVLSCLVFCNYRRFFIVVCWSQIDIEQSSLDLKIFQRFRTKLFLCWVNVIITLLVEIWR